MMKKSIICFYIGLILLCLGCNFAEKTAGQFTGTYYRWNDTITAPVLLNESGHNNLELYMMDTNGFMSIVVNNVEVTSGGTNKYILSNSTVSGTYNDESKILQLDYNDGSLHLIFNGARLY